MAETLGSQGALHDHLKNGGQGDTRSRICFPTDWPFVWGIHRLPMVSRHKWLLTRWCDVWWCVTDLFHTPVPDKCDVMRCDVMCCDVMWCDVWWCVAGLIYTPVPDKGDVMRCDVLPTWSAHQHQIKVMWCVVMCYWPVLHTSTR